MIFNIGYLILITALALSLFGVAVGFWGGQRRRAALVQSSYHAVYAVAALVLLAALILWYGLLTTSIELSYVFQHTERALPWYYKITALWGGQEGSLLFWTLILSVFSATVATMFHNRHTALMPYANAVLLGTSAFFLLLLIFGANPFRFENTILLDGVTYVVRGENMDQFFDDGLGLNPLLQNYWMIIHPVMLYLGYVGLTVPFAFAVAALISGRMGNEWVRLVRRWTLIPWAFLSVGILMGSQWAYMELGWGGYWGWDAVENASLLPWLTATAFLHSIIVQERRNVLKVWNVGLIGATYILVIVGTFTTRSGILSSVHAFAQSDVGPFFFGFLVLITGGFVWLVFHRLPLLRDEGEIDSVWSREAAFMANNWLFTGIAFATLFGTFYPLITEIVFGQQMGLYAPYFNQVNGPLLLLLVLLMGIGPLLGWRRTSLDGLRKQLIWPLAVTAAFAVAFTFYSPRFFPVVGLSVCVLVLVTIVQEFVRGVLARRATVGEGPLAAAVGLLRRNGQRYGGYIVHLGIVMMGIAIIGNEFYAQTTQLTLPRGESVEIGGYALKYIDIEQRRAENYTEVRTRLDVTNAETGRAVGTVYPRHNIYDRQQEMGSTTEVGLISRPSEDIYVVLNTWGENGESATLTIFINPLTMWMWTGGIVLVLGTLVCIWPHPQRRMPVYVPTRAQPIAAAAD